MTRKSVRKSGLDSGHNPPTIVLSKEGALCAGNGSPFRGLGVYPLDLISYEADTFDVVKDETELRAVIERIGRMLGKSFDADAAINDAMQAAPVRVRNQYSEQWAAQALDPGFLTY